MTGPGSNQRLIFPKLDTDESTYVGDIFRRETVGGAAALVAAAIAVIWANTAWGDAYMHLREFKIGPLDLEHWAADGALTLFFFVAGLELKREFVVGSLRKPADAAVPVMAAVCGVALPGLIFLIINEGSKGHPEGWAIPAATDIAFALAVLAIVGSNLPTALRAFLLTLAVVDDLIVITIIAIFLTDSVHLVSLAVSVAALAAYFVAQRMRVSSVFILVPLGLVAWWMMFESGIHATVAGVLLGLLTRVRRDEGEHESPAERLEHVLSPWSSAVAVPFFALMSAGVAVSLGGELFTDPVVIGVIAGLLIGKPIGVLFGAWVVTRFFTHANLSPDLSWRDVVGVALLAGIGFTVALLVADLSLMGEEREAAKAAVLAGSVLSAIAGALFLGHRDRFHATR